VPRVIKSFRDVAPVPPFPTPSVPEMFASVVVAIHVGTPETSARTCPFVPADVVASAPVPLPSTTAPAATFPQPVPPRFTPRMPVTSFARSMAAVATTPAVAFKKPDTLPNVNAFDATSCDVEARVAIVTFVVDAFVRLVCPLKVLVFVRVLAVYVFGIVVDAWMYAFTILSA